VGLLTTEDRPAKPEAHIAGRGRRGASPFKSLLLFASLPFHEGESLPALLVEGA
jgi:hypothetical protein